MKDAIKNANETSNGADDLDMTDAEPAAEESKTSDSWCIGSVHVIILAFCACWFQKFLKRLCSLLFRQILNFSSIIWYEGFIPCLRRISNFEQVLPYEMALTYFGDFDI